LPVDLVDLAVSREQAAFEARQQLLENQQSIIHKQINVTRAEMEAVKAERPAVERQLLVAKERVAIQEGLVERGLASRAELVEAIEVEANYDYRLAELTGRFAVLQAQIKEFEERLEEIDLADRRRAHDRIIEVNATLYEITERIARLIRRVVQTEFRAPVAGIVLSLPETVSGRFIEAGELVAEIVPLGVSLQFVAKLSPRDVGFVASGQSASLKIDSFDFSRYGALTGVVSDVSPTTIVDDKGAAFYEVLIEIPKAYFRDDPEQFALLPGMTGEADILTGKKTVFEYVWKPIYTNLDRALTER
jgi:HlyD family secretion protein/adhesin transport system membrane fusion protein